MYSPTFITSTIIHIIHCSICLRASIHAPTMLNAVVNASSTGTVELVEYASNRYIPYHMADIAAIDTSNIFFDMWVIFTPSFRLVPRQVTNPYPAANK